MDHRNRVTISHNKIKPDKLQAHSLYLERGFIDSLCYSTSGRAELITAIPKRQIFRLKFCFYFVLEIIF